MTITSNDIKLMQPERLTDDEDGGGQMTGREVVDGDINNLFEDISRIDRTYGSVSLRKAFLKVDTPTADLYLGAHAILSAQPADPRVNALLFTTDDFYDVRDSARQRIESFVVPGPDTYLHLRGNQLKGQKTIICYAPISNYVRAPGVGDTFMLQEGENVATQQFIKVLDVTRSQETFSYTTSGGIATFTAVQYILDLSAELRRDFPANDPSPKPSNASKIYSTQQSSSAKYYGTSTLANEAIAGASSVRIAETFAPIIPTASSETPVIDQRPGGFLSQIVPASTSSITLPINIASGTSSTLPTGVIPNSVSFTAGGTQYNDKGGVFLTAASTDGALTGSTIDYKTGAISWAGTLTENNVQLSYTPGVMRDQVPNTGRIEIDDTNRNFNYVLSLDPKPSPGTFNAAYQYLGKWYELQDNASGQLVGDGSGPINYDTGSVILTLTAQPDSGSVIFYRWTEPEIYTQATDDAFASTTPISLQLSNNNIIPGSVVLNWTTGAGAVAQTANDIGSSGAITGHATGTIDYANGRIRITSASAPTDGTGWSVSYDHTDTSPTTAITTVPNNTTRSDIVLQTAENIKPGSVSFTLRKSIRREVRDSNNILISTNFGHETYHLTDNGGGNIIDRRSSSSVGTVNYTTGEIVVAGTSFLKIRNS